MNTIKQAKNYITRQNSWLKANNIKKGDKLLVLKRHENFTKGWDNTWTKSMIPGKILIFVRSHKNRGISLRDPNTKILQKIPFCYPYTVLLPLPKGIYKTRTFTSIKNGKEYKCIVNILKEAKEGEFYFRKSQAFYPNRVGRNVSGTLQYNLVIACELKTPWLPQIIY